MEKLLRDHRHRFGDFEVVEFVDTGEIARLRADLDVEVPLELHWTWTYGSEVAELRQLYEKGKVNQWNAESDLDWSVPVSKDEWVIPPEASRMAQAVRLAGGDEATQKATAFDELAYVLSQLLHGEQAALQLCGQLTNCCETMDEKWYAASQVADEARHVEALSKFLQRKMGTLYPIGPTLKALLDHLLAAESARKKTLGMQCLFEGVAVGLFDMMRQVSRNALFGEMIRRVEQDEARHAAFGILCMRRVVREIEPEQKDELEDWAFSVLETLNANQDLDMLHVLGPKYGLDPHAMVQAVHALPNFADINSLLYMHTVMPNLVRLGLVTERTEPAYRHIGVLTDTRPEVRSLLGVGEAASSA